MSSSKGPDADGIQATTSHQDDEPKRYSTAEIERVSSEHGDAERKTGGADYTKVDKEVAKYSSGAMIEISPEDDIRLRKLIDKRVLVVMIATYFLQSLDKGTLSFSSIMGLPKDTGMLTPDGKVGPEFPWLTTCIYITILVVEYPQVRHTLVPSFWGSKLTTVSTEFYHCSSSCRQIPELLYHMLGYRSLLPCRLQELRRPIGGSHATRSFRVSLPACLRGSLIYVVQA